MNIQLDGASLVELPSDVEAASERAGNKSYGVAGSPLLVQPNHCSTKMAARRERARGFGKNHVTPLAWEEAVIVNSQTLDLYSATQKRSLVDPRRLRGPAY